jgi:MFS family permease
MIGLRILLGIMQSAIFPGLSYLISTWYTRKEQQLRYAFLQSGEVTVVGLGGFLNFGLNHLNGKGGLAGWRWMFLVQGLIAIGKFLEQSLASSLTFPSHWLRHLLLDCRFP